MFRRCVLPFLLLLNVVLATPPSRESYPDQLADGLSSPPVQDTREVRDRSLLRMAEAAMAYKEVPSSQDPTEEEEEGTVAPSPEKVMEMLESEGKALTPADQLDLEFRVNLGLAAREGKHGMAFLQVCLLNHGDV